MAVLHRLPEEGEHGAVLLDQLLCALRQVAGDGLTASDAGDRYPGQVLKHVHHRPGQ